MAQILWVKQEWSQNLISPKAHVYGHSQDRMLWYPHCSPLLWPTGRGRHQSSTLLCMKVETRTQSDLSSALLLAFQTHSGELNVPPPGECIFIFKKSHQKRLRKQKTKFIHISKIQVILVSLILPTNSNPLTMYQWNTAKICLLWHREGFTCLAYSSLYPDQKDNVILLICQIRNYGTEKLG